MPRKRGKTSCLRLSLYSVFFVAALVLLWNLSTSQDVTHVDSSKTLDAYSKQLAGEPASVGGKTEPGSPVAAAASPAKARTTSAPAAITTLYPAWVCPEFVRTEGLIHKGHPGYTAEGLCKAAEAYNRLHPTRKFIGSADDTFNRQELAAFLAHVKHESAGMAAVREYRCCTHMSAGICKEARGKKNCHYCDPKRPSSPDDKACACEPSTAGQSSRLFYGRGPLQLSWNFHYGAMAHAFGMPEICNKPDLVADSPELLWGSAVWYWMEQHDPNCVDDNCHGILVTGRGFGGTTQNVNGCLECKGKQDGVVCARANMFKNNCKKLGVEHLGPLDCGGKSCEPQTCSKCRTDFSCGSRGKLSDGLHAICDAKGEHPCCSNLGWCGNSAAHCSCSGCTDYRQK